MEKHQFGQAGRNIGRLVRLRWRGMRACRPHRGEAHATKPVARRLCLFMHHRLSGTASISSGHAAGRLPLAHVIIARRGCRSNKQSWKLSRLIACSVTRAARRRKLVLASGYSRRGGIGGGALARKNKQQTA